MVNLFNLCLCAATFIFARFSSPKAKASLVVDKVADRIEVIENGNTKTIVGIWTCNANAKTRLLLTGTDDPLIARELAFQYKNIKWSAGQGWPWYYTPCPATGHKHAILMEFGGQTNCTCDMDGHYRGTRATEVVAYVNDDKFDDNVGSYVVEVTFVKTD